MTVALRSSATATVTSGNITCNVPSGVADGDFLLMVVSARNIPSITTPSGWTICPMIEYLGGLVDYKDSANTRLTSYYRVASSEPSSYTITIGTNVGACAAIMAWTGVDNADPFSVDGSIWAPGGSSEALSIITERNNCATISVGALTSAETWNTPTDFTEIFDIATLAPPQTSGHSMSGAYKIQATAGITDFNNQYIEGGNNDPPVYLGLALQLHTYNVAGAAGSFTFTGIAAGVARILQVLGAAASFTMTGVAASMLASRKLTFEAASFAFTGMSANIGKIFIFVADAVSFVSTGVTAGLQASRRIALEAGEVVLTGGRAFLNQIPQYLGGAFTFTGQVVEFLLTTPSGVWRKLTGKSDTWSEGSSSTSSWTKDDPL